LHQAGENRKFDFTQKKLAEKFGFSLSTVFNALKTPRFQGSIKVTGKNFSVVDLEKFLYIWATRRNLNKNIIYKTFYPASAKEIEGMMPAGIIYGAYSAYSQKYGEAPAEYDKVYVYSAEENLDKIKERFPKAKGEPDVFILKSDSYLENLGSIAPDVQTFVDLWNLKDWYAKEFISRLKEKIIK